jgi:hypothetical protein
MLDGDQAWRVRAVHVAGLLLLIAFAVAFALSAFAAKPKPVVLRANPPVELAALLQAAMADALKATPPQWRDVEARLNVRWLEAADTAAPPPGITPAVVRQAAAVIQIGGRVAPFAFQSSGQSVEGWSLAMWGNSDGPMAMELRGADQCQQPCTPAAVNAEQALMYSGMRFMVECETRGIQVLRINAQGRREAYLVNYPADPGKVSRILMFWAPPPELLLKRNGCALVSRQRGSGAAVSSR